MESKSFLLLFSLKIRAIVARLYVDRNDSVTRDKIKREGRRGRRRGRGGEEEKEGKRMYIRSSKILEYVRNRLDLQVER